MNTPPDIPDAPESTAFKQLKWSLQRLSVASSDQLALFPEQSPTADELARAFSRSADVVRVEGERALTAEQSQALSALDGKFATMSRDGAEFDAELWTDTALQESEHWVEIRKLAAAALDAFGWSPSSPAPAPGSETPVHAG